MVAGIRIGIVAAVGLAVGGRAAVGATLLVPEQYPTIQAAVTASGGNDTILVGPGTYAERVDLSSRFVRLRAAQGPAFTTIDGQGLGTVVTWNNAPGQCVLEGFVIANGRGADGADGIAANGLQHGGNGGAGGLRASGMLSVRNCLFVNNRGGNGGRGRDAETTPLAHSAGNGGIGGAGAAQVGINVTMLQCSFVDNFGGNGGDAGRATAGFTQSGIAGVGGPGAVFVDGAFVNLYLSRFIRNSGGDGGRGADSSPIFSSASQPSSGAPGGPGALWYFTGTVTVANDLFALNRGGQGGDGGNGFEVAGGTLVAGAPGGSGGAGVAISSTQPLTLVQITTHANAGGAGGVGGALQGAAGAAGVGICAGAAPATVRNSVMAADGGTLFFPSAFVSYSALPGGTPGAGNVDLQGTPFAFGYRLNGIAALIDSASSIDAPRDGADLDGDFNTVETLPVDLAGNPRVVDAAGIPNTGIGPPPPLDMGAYEYTGPISYPRGDMNCDGAVNNFDIDPFVMALTQPAVYEHVYRNCALEAGDVDSDGMLTNFDIDPFVALLVAP